MFEKIKELQIKHFSIKGVVINEFLKESFLKELEKVLGKEYHLISNHLDLVVVKEKSLGLQEKNLIKSMLHYLLFLLVCVLSPRK